MREEGEECDCGLEERTCADPCCYPGLLGQSHFTANSRYLLENMHYMRVKRPKLESHILISPSARPCHTHPARQCVAPWHGPLVWGLLVPWVTIASMTLMMTTLLCWDYNKARGLFRHLADYTPVSQGENSSQRNQHQSQQRWILLF